MQGLIMEQLRIPEPFSPEGKCQRLLKPISELNINFTYFLNLFAYIDNKIFFCGNNNLQGKLSLIIDINVLRKGLLLTLP